MYKYLLICSVCCSLLYSCSSSEETSKEIDNQVISNKIINFINNKENIVAFGHINLFQLLNKSEYKNNALINAIIDPFISKMGAVNQNSPIYYAVELTDERMTGIDFNQLRINSNFKPQGFVYAFIQIKDNKEFKKQLEEQVRTRFKSSGGIDYAQENNGTIALMDDFMMMMVDLDDHNKVEIEQLRNEAKYLQGNKTNEAISKIMSSTSDIMLTYDMWKIVNAALKSLKISNVETEKLLTDLKGCYNSTNVNFENGKIVFSSENYLSANMSKWKITKNDTKDIAASLGSGSPTGAIAMNLDVDQIEKIIDTYLKSSLEQLKSSLSSKELSEYNQVTSKGFSSVFNGRVGIAAFLNSDGFGSIPQLNFQLGIGPWLNEKLKEPINMAKSSGYTIFSKDNILYGYYGAQNAPGKGSLSLPPGAEDFGSFPINGFIDIQKIPYQELYDIEPAIEILNKLSILKFKVEGDKFTLEIQFKDKSKNSLAQIINSVSGLSI